MPGARANGILAHRAMHIVPMTAAQAVVVNKAPLSIPVSESIAGLTAKIYDMARNEVMPAIISVRIFIVAGSNPTHFFHMGD